MEAHAIAGIAPPPRRVPFTLKTRVVFDEFAATAWLLLAISSLAILLVRNSDLTSLWLFRKGVVSVPGIALGCRRTGLSEGSKHRQTPIFENSYRFTSGDGTHAGMSYAVGDCRLRGAAVVVEHVEGAPDLSRIAGMRRARFGTDAGWVLLLPIVAVLAVAFSLRRGLRRLRLLKHGKLAFRALVASEETNVTVNGQPAKKTRSAIELETGSRRDVAVETQLASALEDQQGEPFLYDPARPDVALAWGAITDELLLDGTGALQPAGARALILALPVPLAVAGYALAFRL